MAVDGEALAYVESRESFILSLERKRIFKPARRAHEIVGEARGARAMMSTSCPPTGSISVAQGTPASCSTGSRADTGDIVERIVMSRVFERFLSNLRRGTAETSTDPADIIVRSLAPIPDLFENDGILA
jgi:hypothetical protein